MKAENRSTNASISTMWAIHNFADLNEFWKVCQEIGFQKIELNHQVNSLLLAGVDLDHHQVSSIHEPCPADIPTSELVERDWLISAMDEELRVKGVNEVKKSIDLAHQLSAPVVVVHCGTIPFYMDYESRLRKLFNAGRVQSKEYSDVQHRFEVSRNALAPRRLQNVKQSLQELIEYALCKNIKLGLENRYHFMDFPSLDEMEELLTLADSTVLGFIYDVGHAQAMDRLGFYPHEQWLLRFSTRMLGCHLHDVIGLADHNAPGLGEIDFSYIAGFLPEGAFRTIEVLPWNTLAQVRSGLYTLAQAGCIRYL